MSEISVGTPEISTQAEYSASYFRKIVFLALDPKILKIRREPEGEKNQEFFSGQNGVEISAEISAGVEISTKNPIFVEISAPVEISTEISIPFCPQKNLLHFIP